MVSQSFQEPSDESDNEIDLFANMDLPDEPLRSQKFKQDTGLYINWLEKLNEKEKWQAYIFLTRTSSGKKLAKNALEKYKERISVNQGLGRELSETRKKLEVFLDVENSEILAVGKWLLGAFSKKGHERQQHLLERNLVHRDDHNDSLNGLRTTLHNMEESAGDSKDLYVEKIKALEGRIDTLRQALKESKERFEKLEDIIRKKYGDDDWDFIQSQFKK